MVDRTPPALPPDSVEPLSPGDRVEIDAPRVSENHGRRGIVVSADEGAVSVRLDGGIDSWLFGRSAVKRIKTQEDSS